MRQIKTVGFIGLGIMGSRMAKNLKAKGFDVVVWNRTEEKAKPLRKLGIEVAAAPSDLAANVDCICTCVSDPKALREVTWGEHGIFQSASRGQLFVDFSTVSPDFSRDLFKECESRGVDFVEAPVTGSKSGAEKGTLVLMVGANDAGVARAEPIFKAVGEKWIHCGPVGSASQVKLAGNAIIALMLEALSEAMLLTKKAGVDPRKLLEVVQASGYRSPYFDFKGKALMERDFETNFSIDLMFKDLQLFLESAAKLKVPTPATGAVKEIYALARAAGKGDLDITAAITPIEELSGVRISDK